MSKTKIIATFDMPMDLEKVGEVVDLKYVFSVKPIPKEKLFQVGLWFNEESELDAATDALEGLGARVEQVVDMPTVPEETTENEEADAPAT